MTKPTNKYAAIIDMPHHRSLTRQPMPMYDRAAQFSPFAALSGYGESIKETARQTDAGAVLSEDALAALDERLAVLLAAKEAEPQVCVTYFKPDAKKSGGAYCRHCGAVKAADSIARQLVFSDGTAIDMAAVVAIEGTIFDTLL